MAGGALGDETKTSYAQLATTFSIWPDEPIAYPDKSRQMESGFGFGVKCTTTLITDYDHPEKLVTSGSTWWVYPAGMLIGIPFFIAWLKNRLGGVTSSLLWASACTWD